MQYDTYCAYSSTRDDKLKAQPYREIRHPQESFPTKETSHMIKDLSKNNIIDSEVAADLHTYPYNFMYNVVDKRRGRVYLLDRRV